MQSNDLEPNKLREASTKKAISACKFRLDYLKSRGSISLQLSPREAPPNIRGVEILGDYS